jgi:hypothetical protein
MGQMNEIRQAALDRFGFDACDQAGYKTLSLALVGERGLLEAAS